MGNPAKLCLFGSSALLVMIGGLMIALWPSINDKILQGQLGLSKTSTSFRLWKDTPIPMYIDIYLYNWTNPKEIKDKTKKPIFTELGPYVFSESHEKVNISFIEGDLVQFHQIRTYRFIPELSNGSLTDLVTNVNVIATSAAYSMRFHPLILSALNTLFFTLGTKIHITKTVNEWLFAGFSDPLIDLIRSINNTHIPQIPFDKFGWFYARNLSWSYDGLFEMRTGADDLSNLGLMTRWNNVSQTRYYDSYCAMVNGTTGELWPPANGTDDITLFATDLCRSMKLEFNESKVVRGVSGNTYTGGRHLLDNGELYPDNTCFCGSEDLEASCVKTGVTNVSLCRYGAPAFISYPHFYLADSSYAEAVDIPPASDDDMFTLALEPKTGIPLDVTAKLQINMMIQHHNQIRIFKDIPTVFMPAIWFNQRAYLTPKLATPLNLLLSLPTIGVSIFSVLIAVGLLLLTIGVYMSIWGRWSKKRRPVEQATLIADDGSLSSGTE